MKEHVIAIKCAEADKIKLHKMIDKCPTTFSFVKRIIFEDGIFNLKLKKRAGPLEWFLVLHAINETFPGTANVVDIRTGIDQMKKWNEAGVKAKEIMDAQKKADV